MSNTNADAKVDIGLIPESDEKFTTPSEHLAQMVQNIPFEVVKYEKNQIKDTIMRTHIECQIKKHLLESKYRSLENKINFIQLSIIFLSAVATFLQAVKDELKINNLLSEIVYIFISSYTALLLSVSRFLKWETQKEEISKLIVNYAQVINKMKHQLRRIQNIDIELREKSWDSILKEFSEENIEGDITKFNTLLDTILSASQKVYYQHKLQHIKVKGFINSKYDTMLNTISSKEHKNRVRISEYKRKGSCCCWVKYDTTRFLKDMEQMVDEYENFKRKERFKEDRKLKGQIETNYRIIIDNNEPTPTQLPTQTSIQTQLPKQAPIQTQTPKKSPTKPPTRKSYPYPSNITSPKLKLVRTVSLPQTEANKIIVYRDISSNDISKSENSLPQTEENRLVVYNDISNSENSVI